MNHNERYTLEFKNDVLRYYSDNKHSVDKASQQFNIPYSTLEYWLRNRWAKTYVRTYELQKRDDINNTTLDIIDNAKVESLVSDYNYNTNCNLILGMIEDKVIELIPKCKSIKDLTGMYKVVSDIKLKLLGVKEKDGEVMSEKATMIMNVIQNQLNVAPGYIHNLLPGKE